MTHRILVVDDEPDITALVAYHLAKAGFRVSTAANGPDALKAARDERPDIVILDLMLPGVSGYDVLAEMRRRDETREVGVILLTARREETDRIRGLTLGADDYLTKPFSPQELSLRVRGLLRRLASPPVTAGSTLAAGPISIDRSAHRASVSGEELSLTATEYKLLLTLVERRGRVQTRPQLLETVWEAQPDIQTRTVDMHVQRLRTKLGDAGKLIETVRGFGYRFKGTERGSSRPVNFATRLVAGTLLVLVLTVAVLLWSAERSLRHDLENDVATTLEGEARLIREALPADSDAWAETVGRRARENGRRITLVDSSGRVRADSDFPSGLPPLENHRDRPEIRAALAGNVGRATRRSESVGRALLYVAVPGGPGAVRVATSLTQVDQIVRSAQRAVAGAALLALAVGTLFAAIAGRSIAGPLTDISTAARAIAAGSPPRFPRSGIPDIDALVQALRQMHRQLGDRFDELRREQAETSALVESMIEGVIAADGRGHIVTANPAARRLLGYGATDPLPDLRELFRVKAAREIVDAVLAGESVEDRQLEMNDRAFLVNARALPTGGGAVLVIHDLTEMRRLEAVRRDFVANVSHELKTPLTSISGYAETLLGESPGADTTRRFLTTILNNARRMQRLVDDLLDLSRIESGRWQPNRVGVSIEAAARESWMALAGRPEAQRVEFDTRIAEDAATLCADLDALRQVLTNLLDNSLRHTQPGGHIICRSRREGNGIAVSIVDDGVGITRDHLPRIFERFYRADSSRSREEGGTGLGLAIVKHLVEAHSGRVHAESERGRGTAVTCWFPDA